MRGFDINKMVMYRMSFWIIIVYSFFIENFSWQLQTGVLTKQKQFRNGIIVMVINDAIAIIIAITTHFSV